LRTLAWAHEHRRGRCGFFFVTLPLETTCLDEAAATERHHLSGTFRVARSSY
jgi:hypothetical protein